MDLSVKYNRRSLKEFVPGKSNSEPDTEQGKKLFHVGPPDGMFASRWQ